MTFTEKFPSGHDRISPEPANTVSASANQGDVPGLGDFDFLVGSWYGKQRRGQW
jgi:hypothetical protein